LNAEENKLSLNDLKKAYHKSYEGDVLIRNLVEIKLLNKTSSGKYLVIDAILKCCPDLRLGGDSLFYYHKPSAKDADKQITDLKKKVKDLEAQLTNLLRDQA